MTIDSITNGIVIDHIVAGKSMQLYKMLGLDLLDCPVAIIKNVQSGKMGKKDIIKIDEELNIDLDLIGLLSPNATVNFIKNGECVNKCHLDLPENVKNVIKCKNPRCITSTEQEIQHLFTLTDRKEQEYRCIYCDTKADLSNFK